MAIKSKELAEMLGVSAATMSLVLNHKPGISDELRNTLLTKIRDMGYGYMIKDYTVSAMVETAGQTKKIAYIIYLEYAEASEESAFFPRIIEGVEREARNLGYQLVVIHMDECLGDYNLVDLKREEYAGIIVQAASLEEDVLTQLGATGIPYVTIDCWKRGMNVSTVSVNYEQGYFMALEYLKNLGHTKIGYIKSGQNSFAFEERNRAFRIGLKDLGLTYNPKYEWDVQGWGAQARSTLEKKLKTLSDLPTAILLENDVLATPVYQAFREKGLKIPEDISVIGFDGREVCSMMVPPLTTLRIPRRFMGRMLIMLLCHKIEMEERGLEHTRVNMKISAEIIEMGSVKELQRSEDDEN